MVPASTCRYGSSLIALIRRPLDLRIVPILAAVIPLPIPDITHHVTNIYFMGFIRGIIYIVIIDYGDARRFCFAKLDHFTMLITF